MMKAVIDRSSSIPTRVRNSEFGINAGLFDSVPAYLQGFETEKMDRNSSCVKTCSSIPTRVRNYTPRSLPPMSGCAFQHTYKGSKLYRSRPSPTTPSLFQHTYKGSKPPIHLRCDSILIKFQHTYKGSKR